jgi:hypothetical protein
MIQGLDCSLLVPIIHLWQEVCMIWINKEIVSIELVEYPEFLCLQKLLWQLWRINEVVNFLNVVARYNSLTIVHCYLEQELSSNLKENMSFVDKFNLFFFE